jgi:2-polyprenyl-3-methyl-5-hydroxy-6-metoxy-1,4-benzoquinol methylase
MTKQNELFDNYLTKHFSHVIDARFRDRKKAFIQHNYIRHLPSRLDAQILEIGPGVGEVLELLTKDLGYTNFAAIDISKEVVDYCNQLLPNSTQLVENSIEFLRNHKNKFDCIIMFHVLEHVPKSEIRSFLNAIYEALKENGVLLIEVPNMGNPITGLNIRYADFTHETGFTELSMQFLMQQAGFASIAIFAGKLTKDLWSRPFQSALQQLVKFAVYIVYRAWAIHPPKIISPVLCVCAVK